MWTPSSDPLQRGVIYTAIRARYVEEAKLSARSVRSFLPGIRIVLFTDVPPDDEAPFDEVVRLTELSPVPHLDKLVCMMRSPFHETLFLDTDTYVCGDVSELFDLLGAFDIAMAFDRRYYDAFPPSTGVPTAFCEFNQGVVVFRRSPQMETMLQASLAWAADIHRHTGVPTDDQTALRIALYASRLRIAPLPLEYNCRFHSYGYLNGQVRILHARIPGARHTDANLQAIARKINKETIPRVFVGGRVHLLARPRFLSRENTFARRGVRLFHPARAMALTLLRSVVRRARRTLPKLGLRWASMFGHDRKIR